MFSGCKVNEIRPLRASRTPRGNPLEPRPRGWRVMARPVHLPREALDVVLFKAADSGYQGSQLWVGGKNSSPARGYG